MSGGGGKAKETKGQNVLPFANALEGESRGLRTTSFDQAVQALATGGVGARMPAINNAITQSQNATNRTLTDMADMQNRTGLAKTAFGQRQLAETRMAGAQQVAGIGPQMAMQVAGQGQGAMGGIIQSIMGALAGQGGGNSKNGRGGIL